MEADGDWNLIRRIDGKGPYKTLKARDLWEKIGYAAWALGRSRPAISNTTMNDWHTVRQAGAIRASNPCSEYMFLDDGLQSRLDQPASLSPGKRRDRHRGLWAHHPPVDHRASGLGDDGAVYQRGDRQALYDYRTLGLGYANIGGLLMTSGIPYDSTGRPRHLPLTTIMTGIAYATSAEWPPNSAPSGYDRNAANMLRVMRNHRRAAWRQRTDAMSWRSIRFRSSGVPT